MSNPKYLVFYSNLIKLVNELDTTDVKLTIGDSINNNRTLTVGQVVRFLDSSRSRKNLKLGTSLQSVYELLRDDIKSNRINLRTDAIDINEFLNFYGEAVISQGDYRNVIGRTVI